MEKNYFREDEAAGLFTLTIAKDSIAEADSLIGSAFAGAAISRSALIVLVGEGCDFGEVARQLRSPMRRPAAFRPAAVSVVVPLACKELARELSFEMALQAIVLGEFTDRADAEVHALRERALVLAAESSASIALRVWSIKADAIFRRSSLRASRRTASDSDLGVSRMVLDA